MVHVELGEAGRAERMPAVNHYPRNLMFCIVIFLTKSALLLVEQLAHELVDLFAIEIRRILGLLEKECCRVLQLFHLIQKIITTTIH